MIVALRTALWFVALLALAPAAASAAAPPGAPQDTTALQFRGFRAGARLAELEAAVRAGGGRLRCDRAKRDRRVSECRGSVTDSTLDEPVQVWASVIDSVAGVITLSAGMNAGSLDRWRRELEIRYGRVRARAQGSQRMMQWVRRGRMLRFTWRRERAGQTASVSLVDGRVLDAWGADRAAGSP
jgi:hypothetical protein